MIDLRLNGWLCHRPEQLEAPRKLDGAWQAAVFSQVGIAKNTFDSGMFRDVINSAFAELCVSLVGSSGFLFEITEMCKNVDDCIKSDCGDQGLCRDLRNPVGNDTIDQYVCDGASGYEEELTGTHTFCENINDCQSSSPCNLVGSCEDALQCYRCSCNAGFETVV